MSKFFHPATQSFDNVILDAYGANLLVAAKMQEAAGNDRANSVSGGIGPWNEAGGPIASVVGQDGRAIDFERASTQNLTPINAAVQVTKGKAALTSSVWLKLESDVIQDIFDEYTSEAAKVRYYNQIDSRKAIVGHRNGASGTFHSLTYSTAMALGIWHHVVTRVDTTNNELAIWINGVKESATVVMDAFEDADSSSGLYMGRTPPPYTNYLDGSLDEAYIWDTALSDAAINELWTASEFGGASPTPLPVARPLVRPLVKQS